MSKTARAPTEEQVQRETAKLHAGDVDNLALWQQFMPTCLAALHEIYRRLGTLPFDHEHGESFYNPMLSDVVDDMLEKGIAFESEGAIVIPNAKGNIPPPEKDKKKQKEEPAAIVRKADGAFLYTSSDLATIKFRVEHYSPDAMLYVVDAGRHCISRRSSRKLDGGATRRCNWNTSALVPSWVRTVSR